MKISSVKRTRKLLTVDQQLRVTQCSWLTFATVTGKIICMYHKETCNGAILTHGNIHTVCIIPCLT